MKVQIGSNRQKKIDFILDNLYLVTNTYGTYVSVYLGTDKESSSVKYFYSLFPVFGWYENVRNQRFFYIEDDFLQYGQLLINNIVTNPAQSQYLISHYNNYVFEYNFSYDLTELKCWIIKNLMGNKVFSSIKRENKCRTVKTKQNVDYLAQKEVKVGGIYSTSSRNLLYLGKCPVNNKYCYVEIIYAASLSDNLETFLKHSMYLRHYYTFVTTKKRLLPCKDSNIQKVVPNFYIDIPDNIWEIVGYWLDLKDE